MYLQNVYELVFKYIYIKYAFFSDKNTCFLKKIYFIKLFKDQKKKKINKIRWNKLHPIWSEPQWNKISSGNFEGLVLLELPPPFPTAYPSIAYFGWLSQRTEARLLVCKTITYELSICDILFAQTNFCLFYQ